MNEEYCTDSLPFIQTPIRIDIDEKQVLFAQILTPSMQDASISWTSKNIQDKNDYRILNLYQISNENRQNIVDIMFYYSNDSQLDEQSLDIITSFQFVPVIQSRESLFEPQ
ncbi:MAG TPA: hypothetical protein VLL52_23770 [Anaerolineae bacterium]|nr:hypothetical protein [Anaerolineae bacterium]